MNFFFFFFFFFNDTATTEIYTLSLHDALPIRASSEAITRSAHNAMSLPPPTHQPCTWAITGFGERHMLMNLGTGPRLCDVVTAKSLPGSHCPSVVRPSSQW